MDMAPGFGYPISLRGLRVGVVLDSEWSGDGLICPTNPISRLVVRSGPKGVVARGR